MTKLSKKNKINGKDIVRMIICPDCFRVKSPNGWLDLSAENRAMLARQSDIIENKECPECAERRQRVERFNLAASYCGACCEL